jgi:hypothetical protein
MSAISERQKLGVQMLMCAALSIVVLPLVTAWTFGQGFLQQLYLQDFGGCLSFHLVSGFSAMAACYLMKARIGRYDPLIIKKNFEDDDEAVFLSTFQVQIQQEKIDFVTESIGKNFHKQYPQITAQVKKIQKAVKRADCDGFFTRNSPAACFAGTLIMMGSLAHISGGLNMQQSKNSLKSN